MKVNFEKIARDVFEHLDASRSIVFMLCGSINVEGLTDKEIEVIQSIPTVKLKGFGKLRSYVIEEFEKSHVFRSNLFRSIPSVMRLQISKNIIKATGTELTEEQEKEITIRAYQGFDFITLVCLIINDLIPYNGQNSIPIVRPINGDVESEALSFFYNCAFNGFYTASLFGATTSNSAMVRFLFNSNRKEKIEYVAGDRDTLLKLKEDFINKEKVTEKDLVPFDLFLASYL